MIVIGTGSIVAAVTTASQREPFILGKHSSYIFEAVMKEYPNIQPERTIMIGDK